MTMKKSLSAVLLVSAIALAANSFPPCNGTFINEVWQAQDGTFWYCNGASWIAVTASPDGGTIGGDLTVYGDAGISKDVSIGGDAGVLANFYTAGTSTFGLNMSVIADGGFHRVAADTDVEVAGQLVPTQHGATQWAVETGMDAGTNGALTVAFGTNFSAAPICFCNHVNTTNTSPCNINSASVPAVGTASFMVDAGSTDKIGWFCMGTK